MLPIRHLERLGRNLAALATAAALALAAACSAPAPLSEEHLYRDANREFEGGSFTTAARYYEEMLKQYPFSDLAENARLRIAHAYYLNKEYEKAIAAFNDFQRLHPTSAMLPFVEYTIGIAYLDQARTRDRDKSASENALLQFERVRDRYPGSLYGSLAEFRIAQCRERLAAHELYVGDYYARSKQKDAARARYRYVIDQYPDTDAALTAGERLAELPAEVSAEDSP